MASKETHSPFSSEKSKSGCLFSMRTKVYLLFLLSSQFPFSCSNVLASVFSSIIIVNVAKSKIRKIKSEKRKEEKKEGFFCLFNMGKSSPFHRYILLLCVLVGVLIFVIDINFKWKQQTRREGPILLTMTFPFYLHRVFLLIKFTPTQSIVFSFYLY
jgi:Ca2+/Na+ antiporter